MTITRRQIMVGAAATVAAAALPAVAVAERAPDLWNGIKVIKTTIYAPWMPMAYYMRGDKITARGRIYIATRNKVSPPFFTERGWQRLEA